MDYQTLNKQYAYIRRNGGIPITTPDLIPKEKPIICNKIKPDHQTRINKNMWWASGYKNPIDKESLEYQIIQKLKTFGGYEACMPNYEEDALKILNRGQLWLGDKYQIKQGRPSKCHANTCDLWLANKDTLTIAIATGYALSKDGIWRQHSWLVLKNPRSVKIIETTTKRIAYFGFVMTEDEALIFCTDNDY